MSRPKLKIDSAAVTKLAELGATQGEIAEFFGCDRSTITKRFSPEIAKGQTNLKIKLRRLQFRAAEKGNVTMLIWLGKTVLGQTEKPTQESQPINIIMPKE